MQYMTAKEAADLWGVGLRRVQYYCANNSIPGAFNMGKQWMIPTSATRPHDYRRKNVEPVETDVFYRFPMFGYTDAYVYAELRKENEKELLHAQMLYYEGKYAESMQVCRSILDSDVATHLKFGAYATIAYNSIIMGLHEEYKTAMNALHSLYEQESLHKDDYLLILKMLRHHITWDPTVLDEIKIDKLSEAGLYYYLCSAILVSAISSVPESETAEMIYDSICRQAEKTGVLTAAFTLHITMAIYYRATGKIENAGYHEAAACEMGYNHRWTGYLAKFYFLNQAAMETHLKKLDPVYADEVATLAADIMECWSIVTKEENGNSPFGSVDQNYQEILGMVAHGYSDAEISAALGMPLDNVKAKLACLCEMLSLTSREELAEYGKQQFAGIR